MADSTHLAIPSPAPAPKAADLFAVPDLWRTSQWMRPDGDGDEVKYYFGQDISGLVIKRPVVDTAVEPSPFFRLPQIDPDVEVEAPLPSLNPVSPAEAAASSLSEPADALQSQRSDDDSFSDDDLWAAAAMPVVKEPAYRSWAAFTSTEQDPPRPEAQLITEARPEAYDVILREQSADDSVADGAIYMACLLSAVLGRESVFFVWDADKKNMSPVIPNLRISGFSRAILSSVESQCLECGHLFRRLQAFVQSTYSKTSSRCRVALASAIETVLGVVESDIALREQPQSVLQLQHLASKAHLVFAQFHGLVSQLRSKHSDEVILQTVFENAQVSEYNSVAIHAAMRVLLQRVSQPWIDFIEEWVGLKHEDGMPLSKSEVGAAKHFVKVEPELYIDDFGEEIEEIDFRLDRDKVPAFVPKDMADSIFDAGRNIRFIRSDHPDHPLANLETVYKSCPPESVWRFDWDSILDLEKKAVEYEATLAQAIRDAQQQRETDSVPMDFELTPGLAAADGWGLQIYGFQEDAIDNHLQGSIRQLNQPLPEVVQSDPLADAIRDCLHASDTDFPGPSRTDSASCSIAAAVTPHWSLLPLLSFNPLTAAHGKIVNRESLKLLFTHHDLMGHLRLQHGFHLFGNGKFASRLTQALFDPHLETTELSRINGKTAAAAGHGGVMGLRLTNRDKWPPASSELRLALMGILAESFTAEAPLGVSSASFTSPSRDLPGDLSFAVRAMTEEDIQKCMDPDALEALDFLRLSYTPPSALAPVFPPLIMMQYDRIFKQMLRVARLLFVVDSLSREAISQRSRRPQAAVARRFCYEAHHFVYTVANYFVDSGITLPWRAFEVWLAGVQADLSRDDDKEKGPEHARRHSPERLRVCHALILDRITIALFLRKRQQPVLKLLNDIFALILRFDKLARLSGLYDNEAEMVQLYALFCTKIEIFITTCRGFTEKSDIPVRLEARDKMDEVRAELGEAVQGNTMNMLLMKLDIAGYYLRGHDE
ncbi:hypothetical protein TD95_003088 [Thielaviopsis punctulata]|uniref:Spindle pole body component n=1 Tax=Thielaviopsis punctulata TaxID=72032 RepID=A0A0F4ZGS8_9PEZI|nr:hypothetical protein TD95_003088 [Thielaviopsis punctulata]